MTTTPSESGVNPTEAMALSERAWAAWQRRRLVLLGIPGALLIPALICALLRDPQPDETDYLVIAMIVFFGLALAFATVPAAAARLSA